MITYSNAPAVRSIADDLIKKHHPHLVNVPIEYVFRSKHKKKGGAEVWGTASKVGGRNAWLKTPLEERSLLAKEFFVLEIAQDIWVKLDESRQVALVDHELTHMDVDIDSGKLVLVPHDVEDFSIILRRHGLYREEVRSFVTAGAEQMTLLALMDSHVDLFNSVQTVTIERAAGSVTLTRAELLAAVAKLDVEHKSGVKLDKEIEAVREEVRREWTQIASGMAIRDGG